MKDFTDYSLLNHNTFGIDARCRRYVEPETVDEARQFFSTCSRDGGDGSSPSESLLIIGGGSNLLFTRDYGGTVVRSGINGIHAFCLDVPLLVDGESAEDSLPSGNAPVYLRCGSGELLDDVVKYAVDHGLCGMENLSLIPGDVGASAVQNVGAYGAEAKDVIATIEAVETATGKDVVFAVENCGYGYRQSRFKSEWHGRYFITHVTYRLSRRFTPNLDYGNIRAELAKKSIETPTLRQLRDVIIDIRQAKLPDWHVEGNAGSFFMNPVVEREVYDRLQAQWADMPHYTIDEQHVKIPAGWLIEQCGWKGRTLGHAGVHERQALVLVNRGGATGGEIVALSDAIRRDVSAKFGIEIKPEVNIY